MVEKPIKSYQFTSKSKLREGKWRTPDSIDATLGSNFQIKETIGLTLHYHTHIIRTVTVNPNQMITVEKQRGIKEWLEVKE